MAQSLNLEISRKAKILSAVNDFLKELFLDTRNTVHLRGVSMGKLYQSAQGVIIPQEIVWEDIVITQETTQLTAAPQISSSEIIPNLRCNQK